jgi:DNA-binding LacI/PurR family transcriptional regulator
MMDVALMNVPPTIRTLAKLAGVSKATISLALRDHPRIRPAERARIQRIAAQAGYRPNALVANLLAQLRVSKTSGYRSTLGLVCVTKNRVLLEVVPTFREWIAGCHARARELGYGIDPFWLHEPGLSAARMIQILDARNIRGLIIVGVLERAVLPPKFDSVWERSAAVVLGARPGRSNLPFVANDQFSTAVRAVEELLALGYRRPGLCLNQGLDETVDNRFGAGFWGAQSKLPIKQRVPVFRYELKAEKRFRLWIKRYRPDAIITAHAPVEQWIESMGLNTPRDIGLVHLDKSSEENWAGMKQNNAQIGSAAIDMLIGQLHRNELGVPLLHQSILIGSTWEPGPSVQGRKHLSVGQKPTS